jgi:hypothetical protein
MGLLPCLDRLDLIRFCFLTLPCKLMELPSVSYYQFVLKQLQLIVRQLNLAINHRGQSDLAVKLHGAVGSRFNLPRAGCISLQNH